MTIELRKDIKKQCKFVHKYKKYEYKLSKKIYYTYEITNILFF
jgi:hypothetical protein